jgi:hypothetical protein
MALDLAHDEVVVASVQNPISVATFRRTDNGNVTPLRSLAGPNTGLQNPLCVAVDDVHDELLVTDGFSHINAFARTATGNVASLRTISGVNTGLNHPFGIALDPASDQILVANSTANSVLVYPRNADGNVTPTRTLVGGSTGLNGPFGIAVDSGELFVTNNGSVTVYPVGAAGNTTPTRTLAGALTGLNGTGGLTATHALLTISPGSGTLVSTQHFDLVLDVAAPPGFGVATGQIVADGSDVTAVLAACLIPGTRAGGGQTFRCPGLFGGLLAPGSHTLFATLTLSDGSSVSDTVQWRAVGNSEP